MDSGLRTRKEFWLISLVERIDVKEDRLQSASVFVWRILLIIMEKHGDVCIRQCRQPEAISSKNYCEVGCFFYETINLGLTYFYMAGNMRSKKQAA